MKAYANAAASAAEQLIAEHIDVAKRIALRVARRCPAWVSRDDLISAAMVGLAEAADRYDQSRNEPFIAFAEKRIRGAVLDELRRGDIMPRRLRSKSRKIGETIRKLEQTLCRRPEDTEIADELGVSVQEYRDELEILTHVSVGALEPAMQQGTPESFLPSFRAEKANLIERVRGALTDLEERDAVILSLYYNEEFTYAEIGKVLGVTASRVCQLHSRAISRMRAVLVEEEAI